MPLIRAVRCYTNRIMNMGALKRSNYKIGNRHCGKYTMIRQLEHICLLHFKVSFIKKIKTILSVP